MFLNLTRGFTLCAQGQLGYGHNRSVGDAPGEMPPGDVPLRWPTDPATVTHLSAGGNHTCSLNTRHELRCVWVWGRVRRGATSNLGSTT